MVLDFLDFLGFPDFLDFLGFPDFHSKRNLHLCVCGSAAYVVSCVCVGQRLRNRNMKMAFFRLKKMCIKHW